MCIKVLFFKKNLRKEIASLAHMFEFDNFLLEDEGQEWRLTLSSLEMNTSQIRTLMVN